jgi:cobalamin synthase
MCVWEKKAMEAERDKRLGRAGAAAAAVLFIWLFSLSSRLAPTSLAFLWSSSASNEFGSSFFVWFSSFFFREMVDDETPFF